MIRENNLWKGSVEVVAEWRNGAIDRQYHGNTILLTGRRAMASSLANVIASTYDFYISRMVFGDGGTVDGVKKYVNANRNGLFGVTRVSKPVIATLDPSVPAQVVFTSVLRFDEGVGLTLSEMALQMASGDFYSMVTFPDLNKTEDMQLTFNWSNAFI